MDTQWFKVVQFSSYLTDRWRSREIGEKEKRNIAISETRRRGEKGEMVGEQTSTILVGIIGAVGAILAASIPYYLTKRNDIALNIQKIN